MVKILKILVLLLIMTIPLDIVVVNNILPEYGESVTDHYVVRVSMYTTDIAQTDDTPFITASGFKLDSLEPGKHRIIAVSRDLKEIFKYGDRVRVEGIGKYDGEYVVRDLMHSRWESKIDILINPEEKAISFDNAKLYKI